MLRIPALAAIAKILIGCALAAGPNVVVVMTDAPLPPALVVESTSLDYFFASPTAVATRAELLTGQHEFRCGVSHVAAGRTLLRPGVATMADVFRAAGYRTAIYGTWGLGEAYPCRPGDRGFEEVRVHGGGTPGDLPDAWGNPARAFAGEATAWATQQLAEKRAFFLLLTDPSVPAELLKALEGSDTVLVFTASQAPKPAVSEEGTRVPCLIRWPGKIPIGKPVAAIASPPDVLPTLAGLCGIKPPEGDGRDLSAALLGKLEFPKDRLIFTQAGGWSGDDAAGRFRGRDFSVRDARWRLSGLELFDQAGDQAKNVFDAHPQEFQRLLAAYGKWWDSVLPVVREPVRYEIGNEAAPVTRLTAYDWWPSKETDAAGPEAVRTQQQMRDFLKNAQVAATRNPLPSTSGHWKLQVAREGSYEVTFALVPPEASAEERSKLGVLRPGIAHIRAGQEELRLAIKQGASSFRVPVDLDAGPIDLEIWFDGQLLNDRILGAFFASVERKGERSAPKPEFHAKPQK